MFYIGSILTAIATFFGITLVRKILTFGIFTGTSLSFPCGTQDMWMITRKNNSTFCVISIRSVSSNVGWSKFRIKFLKM